jgi:queuosine precursor transporter
MFKSRRDKVFFILAGFFITNALVAEMIGGKLITIPGFLGMGPWPMSIGILPWPIVFIATDLTNEYFGKKGVRQLTFLTAGLIAYTFLVLSLSIPVPANEVSPVSDSAFRQVFGMSQGIIIGSIIAFVVSQLVDVAVFWFFRRRTGGKMIWLRATGSTVVAQGVDTFIVQGIAFYLPGMLTLNEFLSIAWNGYSAKILIAIGLTPLIYIGHYAIDRYLKDELKTLPGRN